MKVAVGIRDNSWSSSVYRGIVEVPIDHKFTAVERLVMDRIIVYDDGVWIGLDWGRHWRDMSNYDNPVFVLEYIRLPGSRKIKLYTEARYIGVKLEDVLMMSDQVLNKLASVVLMVRNKDRLDDKVVKQLRKEVLKILFRI